MADLNSIVASLLSGNNVQEKVAASDPYAQYNKIGSEMQSVALQYPGASLKDRLVGSLFSGLLGGVTQGLSNNYQVRATNAYNDALMGKEGAGAKLADLSPALFQDASSANNIFKMNSIFGQQDMQNDLQKIALTEKLKSLYSGNAEKEAETTHRAGLEAIAKNPKKAKVIASLYGIDLPAGFDTAEPAATTEESKPNRFGGGPTLEDKLNARLAKFAENTSPSAAAELAAKSLGADFAVNKSAADEVTKARKAVDSMNEVIGIAEPAIAGAGETGGTFGGVRNVLSKLAGSTYSSDQAAKMAAQAQLDSLGTKLVGAAKYPGAISDSDLRILLASGPSSGKTPEQNRALVDNIKIVKDNQNDYANFLDAYLAEKGDLVGANGLWSKYTKDHPLTTVTDDGTPVLNSKRVPWSDYFTPGGATPQTSAPPMSASGSVPSVGSVFNGEKVVSIRKIR